MLIEHDIDTVLVAFTESDRAEFFGALITYHEYGVSVLAHRAHANQVLTSGFEDSEELVEIDLHPWDWLDYVVKRLFDLAFSGIGLIMLSPVICCIAVAIKLDSPGPVLYSQERTAEFGETFTVYKFRSMVTDAESSAGAKISEEDAWCRPTRDPRRPRPPSHPSRRDSTAVVGPRPEWPELDADIERGVADWSSRWSVKPGLTGLAQINGASGHEPDWRLRYDLEYIRKQSFWFDLKICIRQVWGVMADVVETVRD